MRALTIKQPFAELIARGVKRVENRTWRTHYRGPLAIHAGLDPGWAARLPPPPGSEGLDPRRLTYGAIIAVAQLVACLRVAELPLLTTGLDADAELVRVHASGPWCWVLDSPRRLPTPLPLPGKQGLWHLPEGLILT